MHSSRWCNIKKIHLKLLTSVAKPFRCAEALLPVAGAADEDDNVVETNVDEDVEQRHSTNSSVSESDSGANAASADPDFFVTSDDSNTVYYNTKLALQRKRFIASGMDSLSAGTKISCEVSLLHMLSTKGLALNNYDLLMSWFQNNASKLVPGRIPSTISFLSRNECMKQLND